MKSGVLVFSAWLLAGCQGGSGDFDPPIADVHVNETAIGTWTITYMKETVSSVWYQDDLNQLLHLNAGTEKNSHFLADFYFNGTGHYAIEKDDDNTTLGTEFLCEYSAECDYNCELEGYSDKYVEWAGRYEMLALDNAIVDAYVGPALDALGIYPSQTYMTVGEDDNGTVNGTEESALYKGMDLFMVFGGLGRYWFDDVEEVRPTKDLTENTLCKGPDSTFTVDQTDNSSIPYDWLDNDMDQFPTQFAKGEYTNPRLDNFDTDAIYFHNATAKQLRIDIGSCSLKNSGRKSYLSYYYNETDAFVIDVLSDDITQFTDENYDTFVAGMSGVPNPMAYVGPLKVIEHDNAETDTILAVFGGLATFVNGGTKGMLRYYDNATGLLVGIDITNDGVDFGETYERNMTGFARLWLDEIVPFDDKLMGTAFDFDSILDVCKGNKNNGLSDTVKWIIIAVCIVVVIAAIIAAVMVARCKGYCGGGAESGGGYEAM